MLTSEAVILLLAAAFPLLSILILLVILRVSVVKAMALGFGGTFLLAFSVWQLPLLQLLAAALEGALIAFSILWIIFGAMLLLFWQQQSGNLTLLVQSLQRLSPDPRLQLLWLSWFAVAFLEGISGFGTPAAIIAPILISLGFAPVAAAALPLIADSSAVSFGAIGTPVLIGISQGAPQLSAEEIQQVYLLAARIDIWAAPLLPVLLMLIYCRWLSCAKSYRAFFQVLPLTLIAGFSYSLVLYLTALWLGPEFPSIMAAVVGFVLSYACSKISWLQPAALPATAEHQQVTAAADTAATVSPPTTAQPLLLALLPYLLLVLLLLLSRLPQLPFKAWLMEQQITFSHILGTSISASLAPLYLPGTFFVVTLLLLAPFYQQGLRLFKQSAGLAFGRLKTSAMTLLFAVPMVRIFVLSDNPEAGLAAMPAYLAKTAVATLGDYWFGFAAWLGALGSFVAGSATFSNLMFAKVQLQIAADTGLSAVGLLALQMLGANAGNMICIVNIVAVVSVIQKNGIEARVLGLTLLPMTLYLLWLTFLGWWLLR